VGEHRWVSSRSRWSHRRPRTQGEPLPPHPLLVGTYGALWPASSGSILCHITRFLSVRFYLIVLCVTLQCLVAGVSLSVGCIFINGALEEGCGGASTATLVLGLWHEARLISHPPQLPGHFPRFGPCLIVPRFLENVSGMFALVMFVYATNKLPSWTSVIS
jgi:hypothetical protein